MRMIFPIVASAIAVLACVTTDEVFAQPNSDAELPRVLIIGDSISIGYTPATRELLKGKARVEHNRGNAGHTAMGLKGLKGWLGDGRWDVIHFNWGLWDLCYRNPKSKMQGHRDKVDGKLTHSPEQYEKNLRELVKQLKATGARLVWANTTPVPEGEAGRIRGDELKYNAVAEKIMKENGIPINDLHGHATQKIDEIQLPGGNVHFTKEGSRHLAEKVAEVIRKELGTAAKQPGP